MRRRNMALLAVAALAAAGLAGGALTAPEGGQAGPSAGRGGEEVFRATLADPSLYENGIYAGMFETPLKTDGSAFDDDIRSMYVLGFVPSGSSPKVLSIEMRGAAGHFEYAESFVLNGTRHEAGLGEFYTWEYLGDNDVSIPDGDTISITIDPNGDTQGSVSVYVYRAN